MAVTVGLYVPLRAKPGKDAEVESFLERAARWSRMSRRRPRGSRSGSDLPSTRSSASSQTTRAARHTSQGRLRRH
jgi:hypothetical protein